MRKILLTALPAACFALAAAALDLGDSAPPISPDTWVTGQAADPAKPDDSTIFLVEVWSTTCPPCVRTIPLLGDIQKRYADQGLKIVSFTTDSLAEVEPFIKDHPIEYSSFIDKEAETFISYMAADNRNTIPHAFLFDRSGRLVWTGNPLDNIEERVRQVLDGTLNGDKALAVRQARDGLQASYEEQNIGGMFAALDQLESLEPDNAQYYQIHYRLLSQFGGEAGEISELLAAWYEGCRNRSDALIVLSMVAIEQGHPDHRDPGLSLRAARRAFELDSPNRIEAGLNLAEVYQEIGRLDLSLATLEKLKDSGDETELRFVDAITAFYVQLRELGQSLEEE